MLSCVYSVFYIFYYLLIFITIFINKDNLWNFLGYLKCKGCIGMKSRDQSQTEMNNVVLFWSIKVLGWLERLEMSI